MKAPARIRAEAFSTGIATRCLSAGFCRVRYFFSSSYFVRFGPKTGKLIGSVQNFRSVFAFLAFSFMTIPP
jgi:hypothetical protein